MENKQAFMVFLTLFSGYCSAANSSNTPLNIIYNNNKMPQIKRAKGLSMWLAASAGDLNSLKHWIETKQRDPNQQDRNGRTPLHWAAGRGNKNIVQYLLKHNASVNIQDNDGCTALARASSKKHHEIVNILLKQQAKAIITDRYGKYPLHWAAGNCAKSTQLLLKACPTIVDKQDKTGQSPLGWACGSNNLQATKVLLQHGATPNIADKHGQTPLHQAASIGSFKSAELLIGCGAKIDLQCKKGKTPLQWAAAKGNYDIVRLLLLNGADPNTQSFIKKRTSLSWAIRMRKGAKKKRGKQIPPKTAQLIIEELLKFNAKTNIQDCFGKTPLQWAKEYNWKQEVYLMQHKNIHQHINKDREERLARPFAHLAWPKPSKI